MVSKNPAFSAYAIDDPIEPPPFAPQGVANPAYENCPTDQTDPSHHYERAGDLPQARLQRQKTNALYESVPPQTSKKYQEDSGFYGSKRDACLNCVILFVILFISIIALLLVIFIILGILGPSCSCTSKSTGNNTHITSYSILH